MRKFFITIFFFVSYSPFAEAQEIEDTLELDQIIIRGKIIEKYPYITSRVNKKILRDNNTHDVGDYLRNIPNVSGIRKGGNSIDPVVRGFKYSQLNVILSNGIKVENGCPNRMDPVSSHIEAEDIKNIEVIKGPFTLRYGPNFGGVINLDAQDPAPYNKFQVHSDALYGYESNWNGHKGHLSINGGGKKVFFQLAGGYRNYGDYKSGKIEGTDTTYSSAFTKFNYSASAGYSINKNQSLTASYDNVQSRNVMYPALSMDEKSDNTRIVSLDYKANNLGRVIKSADVKFYRSMVHHVMDNSRRPSSKLMLMVADVNAANTGGRAELDISSGIHNLIVGLDYENIFKDGKRTGTMEMMGTTSTRISNLWNNARIQNTGLFAEYRLPVSLWEIMASIRTDLNTATSGDTLNIVRNNIDYFGDVNSHFLNLSISAGATKFFSESFSVAFATGRGTRSPNMLERYIKLLPVGYDNYDYLGNPGLKPETNNEADLTFRYNDINIGSFSLNGFFSVVQNYITANLIPPTVITPQTQGVLGVKQFENADYATFRGFEFGYLSPDKYRLGLQVVSAYTYATIPTVTKYITTGSQITGETTLKNDALPEIPPLEATFAVRYKLAKGRIVPRITVRTVAAQHHVSGAFYEPATPGFTLMHFTCKFSIGEHIDLLAGVNNIFNRAYYEHLNRKIIGTTQKLYEPGRVFFINVSARI